MAPKVIGSALAAVAIAAALAAPAQASYVLRGFDGTGGGTLYSPTGEVNDVSVAYDAAAHVYVIQDAAGISQPGRNGFEGQGCTARSRTVVACAWSSFEAQLGDGDDRLTVTSAAAPRTVTVSCIGGGLLPVPAAPQGVVVSGGPGKDVLTGNAGADCLYGAGAWDDHPGEPEYEVGDDTLVGGDGPDFLVAGNGNDHVEAGPGDDRMAGNDGNDFIDAGAGDDAVEVYQLGEEPDDGSGGDDRILGGPGNDGIHALHGRDVVDAGAGNDRIYSLDELWQIKGPSRVTCGAGIDQFGPERGDVVSGCERLYELWPPHLPLCGPCTFKLQAKIGSRLSFLTQLRMVLTKQKSWAVIPIGRPARALVQARGTLQVRVLYGSGSGPLFAREWFTLRR